MADILILNQTAPTTPAASNSILYVDSTTKRTVQIDDGGNNKGLLSNNYSTASQGAGFASDTYVTNSGILIPSFGMKAGQLYRWFIGLSKTAAGTAATILQFRIGSNQSTADTSRLSLTASVAQTAAIAEGILTATLLVRSVSASGVIAGAFGIASSVGLGGGKDGVSSAFDNTSLAGQYLGISVNGGASAAWTVTSVFGELVA
jgi:hypothetical protein